MRRCPLVVVRVAGPPSVHVDSVVDDDKLLLKINIAVFDMKRNKATCPGGFPIDHYWSYICHDYPYQNVQELIVLRNKGNNFLKKINKVINNRAMVEGP